MLRAFCSEWDGSDQVPVLSRGEIHHLVRVRRVRNGETVEILNGQGDILSCTVEIVSGKNLQLSVDNLKNVEKGPVVRHLLVAMPKGKTFPTILQKAVELGVAEITPLVTDNSEIAQSRADRKSDRWEAVLTEAVKQSGNPWMPTLNPPSSLKSCLEGTPDSEIRICAALQPDARPLLSVLDEHCPEKGVAKVFVGPEGDFSKREYQLLRESGCHFITLGDVVLKVETAASLTMGTIALWCHERPTRK